MKQKNIILASNNLGKIEEFQSYFSPLGITILSLKEMGIESDPDESGLTFVENALIKARAVAKASGLPTLADDSGLVVPALNGAPGLHSARYSEEGSDQANNKKLLREMRHLSTEERSAYFHSTILLLRYEHDPTPTIATGEVWGNILPTPRGEGGFGYDPLFYYPKLNQSFAEIPLTQKNELSHRAQALKKLINQLKNDPLFTTPHL